MFSHARGWMHRAASSKEDDGARGFWRLFDVVLGSHFDTQANDPQLIKFAVEQSIEKLAGSLR